MKPRIVLIIIGVIIVIGAIVYGVFAWMNAGTNGLGAGSSGGAGATGAATTGGTGQAISVAAAYPNAPTGPYLSIGTASGTVQVANFYTASSTQVSDDGTLIINQTSDYYIEYDPSDSTFWLAITGTPFATVQQTAEQAFVTTLGVTEAEACELDATVGVPYSAGSSMNGQSFPLSFCE